MDTESEHTRPETVSWVNDMWGGLAAMLVALPSSVAFGILVYTAFGQEYAGQGALAGLLGAAALGIIAPLCGRTGGLISAPCAPSAAILTALIAGLISGSNGTRLEPAAIMPLMALTALLSALLQTLYGIIGGGRLIKFIPFQVVSGYLSGVALLIAIGQIPKLLGLPKGIDLVQGLLSPALWKWQGLVVGIVTMVAMALAPLVTRKIPAVIFGLLAGILAYFCMSPLFPALLELHGNPLIIGPLPSSGSLLEALTSQAHSLTAIDPRALHLILVPAITLSILLSIDTLKTCVGLDALTRSRHNSNRELIGQGLGNLATFMVGGIPGSGAMGPTLVNVTSGGRSPRSGVIEGVLVVLVLVFLSGLIAWVPIGALAGILLMIAWRMFDKDMFRLLRYPAGRLDFCVIAGVVLVALTVDLIAASGVGVAMAILLFIRDQARGSVIRRKHYLNQMSSKTRRQAAEREILKRDGGQAVFCELQGNLFFGTTDQLFSQLEPDLRTCRYLLLDMRHVQSIDYTAVHLFDQMHAQLAERGGQLLFSGMPSGILEQRDFESYLAQMGLVRGSDGVMITETRDSALEWMEERILEAAGYVRSNEEKLLDLKDFQLFREIDEQDLAALAGYVGKLSLRQGEKAFRSGDQGDELYLVRRGVLRVLLPLEGGKYHHLATIGQGGVIGDLAFLDRGIRSADVEAKVDTDLFVLSRSRFNELARANAAMGVQVFARLALSIAESLRQSDAELRALEER
ncbi:MAG: SulP family inorganic anion transporter [Desulfobacteraceae bacterium]|nr:SulP family inorganic anion transporter [Desulfobacteraceae bacterium]